MVLSSCWVFSATPCAGGFRGREALALRAPESQKCRYAVCTEYWRSNGICENRVKRWIDETKRGVGESQAGLGPGSH
eukprot:954070-Rhodomonas_salina.2